MSFPSVSMMTPLPMAEASVTAPSPLCAGMRVDRYEIIRALGVGGSADVYEAEHVDLGRRVALKVVRCSAAESEETHERFRREARTSGSLRHPNIADVFDVGYTDGGSPYLVMELLNGESLDAWIERGPLSLAAAIEVSAQLADALAFVHASNILHRDIKPQNIMLHRERGGRTVAKLVDFGISKPVVLAAAERAITREGLVIGTPHYMAPESLRGGLANERTETYSVGVVLYESLAGKPPFDEESMSELVASILRDSPPSLAVARPGCPAQLVALVERAMHRDPSRRFGSAAEFALELRRVGAEIGLELGPLALGAARSSDDTAGLVSTWLGLGLVATTENPISASTRPPGAPRSARFAWIAASATALFIATSAGLIGLGAGRLTAAERPNSRPTAAVAAAAEPTAAQVLETTPVVATAPIAMLALAVPSGLSPPIEPPARAPARRGGAKAANVGSPAHVTTPAAPVSATDDGARRDGAPRRNTSGARALTQSALSSYATGQFPRALALYREAVRQDPRAADAWRGLGAVSARMGQPNDARRAFRTYLQLAPGAADAARVQAALDGLSP